MDWKLEKYSIKFIQSNFSSETQEIYMKFPLVERGTEIKADKSRSHWTHYSWKQPPGIRTTQLFSCVWLFWLVTCEIVTLVAAFPKKNMTYSLDLTCGNGPNGQSTKPDGSLIRYYWRIRGPPLNFGTWPYGKYTWLNDSDTNGDRNNHPFGMGRVATVWLVFSHR